MSETALESSPLAIALPEIVQRYLNGESLMQLSAECAMSAEGLRIAIRRWAYSYSGDNQAYNEIVEQVLVNRLIDREDQLDIAADSVGIARAREALNQARWIASRRLPKKFGEKFESSHDSRITVIVQRERPQPVTIDTQPIDIVDGHTPNHGVLPNKT